MVNILFIINYILIKFRGGAGLISTLPVLKCFSLSPALKVYCDMERQWICRCSDSDIIGVNRLNERTQSHWLRAVLSFHAA